MSKKLERANQSIELTKEEIAEMINAATEAYAKFMDTLKIDWKNDPHSSDTPRRVAKSFINDIIAGCYSGAPNITAFENTDGYDGIVFQGDIEVKSICSHHHLPFVGKAHVAYIPGADGKVIGLSKLNRIVEWFARRPQVQENLTMQVHDFINNTCNGNKGVSVMIEAKHMCASCRGVRHDSTMMTSKLSGGFMDDAKVRDEFYNFVKRLDK
jgi:GTP cyclohydrolase I